jgi:hypothetical protein
MMLSAASTVLAQTQSAAPPVLPVPASDSLCTYDRCALWLDVHGLVQGADARLLARHRWLRSLPLRRFVSGDSAIHYAMRYEHERRRGTTLSALGGLALSAGMVIALAHDCGFGADRCEISNRAAAVTITLILGGIAVDLVGQRSTTRAGRARARALWWHNRQFAR